CTSGRYLPPPMDDRNPPSSGAVNRVVIKIWGPVNDGSGIFGPFVFVNLQVNEHLIRGVAVFDRRDDLSLIEAIGLQQAFYGVHGVCEVFLVEGRAEVELGGADNLASIRRRCDLAIYRNTANEPSISSHKANHDTGARRLCFDGNIIEPAGRE